MVVPGAYDFVQGEAIGRADAQGLMRRRISQRCDLWKSFRTSTRTVETSDRIGMLSPMV
jgi:hypothetical protein